MIRRPRPGSTVGPTPSTSSPRRTSSDQCCSSRRATPTLPVRPRKAPASCGIWASSIPSRSEHSGSPVASRSRSRPTTGGPSRSEPRPGSPAVARTSVWIWRRTTSQVGEREQAWPTGGTTSEIRGPTGISTPTFFRLAGGCSWCTRTSPTDRAMRSASIVPSTRSPPRGRGAWKLRRRTSSSICTPNRTRS